MGEAIYAYLYIDRSFYVLGQDGVEKIPPDHSLGLGKASVGFGPWYGFLWGRI